MWKGYLLRATIQEESLVQLRAVSNLPKICITDNLLEIYNRIMHFLKDCDSMYNSASVSSGQELEAPVRRESPSTTPLKDSSAANNGGNKSSVRDFNEVQRVGFGGNKEATPIHVVDELETLVKIIQAEAKMFQSRADDARRKSEYLKHISIVKSKKIEEGYAARLAKLQLAKVEEKRKKKLDELQVLQRSYQEYMKTWTRMQEDIKELCLTMGNAKSNLIND